MPRTPIICGNWKMHKSPNEAVAFVNELAPRVAGYDSVERVLAPTFLALAAVAVAAHGAPLQVAAQDGHWAPQGAYTSQVSAEMLRPYVNYVIIGHSECRAFLNETDVNVNRKAKAILAAGLRPIIAVGESLEQNQAGETVDFVQSQVKAALAGVSARDMANVVIAYEPIWAIGTGLSASGSMADAIIKSAVRDTIAALYDDAVASSIRIQYGGSVKPGNMEEFMSQPNIDGALVGGASLQVDDFTALIEIAARVKG